jgi:hypothetical protein
MMKHSFPRYSPTADESTDTTSTVRTRIFARSITSDFEVFEEVDAHSMQGQKKG